MLDRLKTFSTVSLLATVGVCSLTSAAQAQFSRDPNPIRPDRAVVYQSIPELFDAAYYSNGGTYFYQRSIVGQVQNFLGMPRFSEANGRRSAELVNILHKNLMDVQNTSSPLVRTEDLYNPFDQNLVVSPSVSVGADPIPPIPAPFVPFSTPVPPAAPLLPAPPPPAPEPQLF